MQLKNTLSAAIKNYLAINKLTYEQCAQNIGVCKTSLHRAANGNWKKDSHAIKLIAEKFDVPLEERKDPTECLPILAAINEIWDGSEEQATRLASMLKDLHYLTLRQKT